MSFSITERIIKLLCGSRSFDKGEAYFRAGKVTFTNYDAEASVYEAIVRGTERYEVTIEIDHNGDVDAECSCPAFYSYNNYCKHIAAVLLHIRHKQQDGRPTTRSSSFRAEPEEGVLAPRFTAASAASSRFAAVDSQLTNGILELFGNKKLRPGTGIALLEQRTPLDVEFICRLFPYGYRKHMFGIEIKVGPKRLYVVQKIRQFLERIDRGEAYEFSKHFTYEPQLHCFQRENLALLEQLIKVLRNEQLYRESASAYSVHASHASGDRMLPIPPNSWEALQPLLTAAPSVRLEHGGRTFEGLQLSDEPIPLQFTIDESKNEGCQLNIQGLDDLVILEAYGVILTDGKLLKLLPEQCTRLSELRRLLDASRKHKVRIFPDQIEPFMEKVIPGLMKLGSVRIADAVSRRILQTQLKAKLYLDRVKDRLLAGLEFQYGDIVINPLEASGQRRSESRILIRDGEQEARILALMEQSSFAKTEAGYFLDDEEAEYDFLCHIVPELEKLLDIYATAAVKTRLFVGQAPPKIRVDVDERTDWLEFRFDMNGIPETEIRNVLQSLEEKRKYHRLPNGSLLPLETAEFQEIIRFMNEVGIRKADLKGTEMRLPAVRGLHLLDAGKQGNSIKLGKAFRQLLENMRNPDNLDFPLPEDLSSVLRDYQKFGFQWLKTLAHYRFGGILADDMGLGKTLQSIAFLVSVLPEIREKHMPALIICPASLVYNWRNELKKFAPQLQAVIADGSKTERNGVLKDMSQVDVIITSYPLLRRDIELYAWHTFHTLFLDEAQTFKNHATQTAQAVKALAARHRFALTGTPVENTLEELWSIFDAVFPDLFPGRKAFNDLSREIIAKRARPFLLRRLKSDVLKELPEKIESLQASELLPDQKKLYVAYLAKLQQETLKHLNDNDFQKNRIKILAGLTRLRQLCCHPALFVEGYTGSSAKFEQLLEIVEECRSAGKRMLVFSQFTEMLGLIGRELGYRGIPYFYLDGKTPTAERVELCDRFNKGERDLFLISLKAGGTGLNLTGADTVILYDLWWNPAVEQQAADRAHRIGQRNVVQVIRLVTEGTIEDKMYALQQRKKNLIEEVIQPGQEALSSLTEQDIREILMIG